jgi:hypothetical protein
MLNIYGTPGSEEYAAAEYLRSLLLAGWPDADTEQFGTVTLIPSAKCYGEKRQDIDLIVIGSLKKPKKIHHKMSGAIPYSVISFFWTIEVKGQIAKDVTFQGQKVFVRYKTGKLLDASEQSEDQKYSVLNYLNRHDVRPQPFIRNFVWLRNIPEASLPSSCNNILGSDCSWFDILNKFLVLEEDGLKRKKRTLIESIPQARSNEVLRSAEIFTKQLESSHLSRKKIEQISNQLLDGQKYEEKLGEQFLVFRGRGGTGKTIKLLRIAHDIYMLKAAKVLILTYNLALVADIKRMFAVLKIPSDGDAPSIKVTSIHQYLYQTLKDLGLKVELNMFLQNFEALKEEALALEAIDEGDIEHWDFVLIDEAQDWPVDERDLLFKLYGPRRIVVADGVDQLVRGSRPTDWSTAIKNMPKQIVPLKKSMRLKANLCRFANEFATELGFMGWKLDVAEELHGGRVVVIIGDLSLVEPFIAKEIEEAKRSDVQPIDNLVCAPPVQTYGRYGDGITDSVGGNKESIAKSAVAEQLEAWGHKVWDGISKDVRRSYPTDLEQIRLVQYDSCRGLEGWVVFCLSLDQLYDYKVQTFDHKKVEGDLYITPEEAAQNFAKSWLMIPMTRAMDVLVIHVSGSDHVVTDVLRTVKTKMPGVIKWIERTP